MGIKKRERCTLHFGTKPDRLETSNHPLFHEFGSEWVSGSSEQTNGREIGPVLMSGFLVVPDHDAMCRKQEVQEMGENG